jgi:hypothetical protein
MYDMPEPDGPLTEEQLDAVARTRYALEQLQRGVPIERIGKLWDQSTPAFRSPIREDLRQVVITANAHWGNHVRRHQSELIRKAGDSTDLTVAITSLIERYGDPDEFALELANLLGLR